MCLVSTYCRFGPVNCFAQRRQVTDFSEDECCDGDRAVMMPADEADERPAFGVTDGTATTHCQSCNTIPNS